MWNYYWGYTAAQIELAIADGPVIVYKHDKKGTDGKKKKPTGASVERAALQWEQEHKQDGGKITVDLSDYKLG